MSEAVDIVTSSTSTDPATGLTGIAALHRLAETLEALQVDNARRHGWSWAEIAELLGVSKQAVHQKHAARLASSDPDPHRSTGRTSRRTSKLTRKIQEAVNVRPLHPRSPRRRRRRQEPLQPPRRRPHPRRAPAAGCGHHPQRPHRRRLRRGGPRPRRSGGVVASTPPTPTPTRWAAWASTSTRCAVRPKPPSAPGPCTAPPAHTADARGTPASPPTARGRVAPRPRRGRHRHPGGRTAPGQRARSRPRGPRAPTAGPPWPTTTPLRPSPCSRPERIRRRCVRACCGGSTAPPEAPPQPARRVLNHHFGGRNPRQGAEMFTVIPRGARSTAAEDDLFR